MITYNNFFKFLSGFILFAITLFEGADIVESRFGIEINNSIIIIIIVTVFSLGIIYNYLIYRAPRCCVPERIFLNESLERMARSLKTRFGGTIAEFGQAHDCPSSIFPLKWSTFERKSFFFRVSAI